MMLFFFFPNSVKFCPIVFYNFIGSLRLGYMCSILSANYWTILFSTFTDDAFFPILSLFEVSTCRMTAALVIDEYLLSSWRANDTYKFGRSADITQISSSHTGTVRVWNDFRVKTYSPKKFRNIFNFFWIITRQLFL